ncbi:MAG TPA: DUF2760 domain-containing protein [Polyangiaceae bacterium]|nr:DUF2760 domain-containing protein [Polyangiaceae bacterium]
MSTETLPFATRIWFAWLCLFRVLFDGRFAMRLWGARDAPQLPASPHVAGADGARDGPAPSAVTSRAADTAAGPALQLLSLLQRDGRLVDFLQQDIASFSDADVGVAARVVHEGCRRALFAHATVEPVRSETEGARVTLSAGFDADAVKLVGEVTGQPPYAGVLRHRGWRASRIELPQTVGAHDQRILAPAEVELG